MKKNQLWINTRVELQWNADTQRYDEVSVEGYWADADSVAYAHTNPSLDQDTYAWYNDGTESGSTIIGTANNSQTLDADTTYLVRFVLQETAGGSSNNFSSQLEYDVNNSGTFANVTSTSNSVRAVASGNLAADGSDTTQRLGAGTFITPNAGVDNGDGAAGTTSFAGNDEFEVVYAIQLRSADLTNGDTVQLRVAGMNTYTNTANATASVPNNVTVTLTGQNQAVTNGTLTIARNFKKSINTTGQNLATTGGTLSVVQTGGTVITLAGDAVAVTGGTTAVQINSNITLVPTNLAVTEGTTSVSLDRRIDPLGNSVVITEGSLAITTSSSVVVNLTGEPVGVSGSSLSIARNLRKNVSTTGEAVAVTGNTLTIQSGVSNDITITGDTISVIAGSIRYTTTRRAKMDNSHTPMVINSKSFEDLYANGSDWFTY